MSEQRWTYGAKGQRHPPDMGESWEAGEYTFILDRMGTPTVDEVSKGDLLTLDAEEAIRLGNAGAIAVPGSRVAIEARVAAGKGSRHDEILVENARTTGVWTSG